MTTAASQDWQIFNQRCLATALANIRHHLQRYIAQQKAPSKEKIAEGDTVEQPSDAVDRESPDRESPSALAYLSSAFALTSFEQQVLLLCAGVELSAEVTQLCAAAQGNERFTYPTFSLALAAFPTAQWDALAPVAPLRRWRLIEVVDSDSLTQSRLRVDERVLHYLTGVPYLDDRLDGLLLPLSAPRHLLPSQQQTVQRMVDIWTTERQDVLAPMVQLCGGDRYAVEAIAASACQAIGTGLYRLRAEDIPTAVAEREALARLCEREAILSKSFLLLDCADVGRGSASLLKQRVVPFVESLRTQLIISSVEPFAVGDRTLVHLEVPQSSLAEQRMLWQRALEPCQLDLNGHLDGLVSQFNLSAAMIHAVCAEVNSQVQAQTKAQIKAPTQPVSAHLLTDQLWETCRLQTRPRLNELAQRIVPRATWNELVLPEREHQMLREVVAQVRQQAKVYDTWAFSTRGVNGLGISALFSGPSGTGKTLAAEVLAHELRLDLYRIDLSQVVSKYIGETEKNLRQVFDAAESGGAILLFDEADALFGKRSDVKDARDRYANIEVSYLLQRMEGYRGLAILTTNLKKSIDFAFLRRLRFVVQFPFPQADQRLEIWQRIFPPQLPTKNLNFDQLARLNITGGNIRNIALNAAFLAADENAAVEMRHLLRAAKTEYSKLEKTLTNAEVGDWK